MNTSVPPNWGKDPLSEFVDVARHNGFATFANCPVEYNLLSTVDGLFRHAIDNLVNTPEWFAAFFLLKCHSAYLGASAFSISGQCAESYMVLRGCLESALYGLYLCRHKNSCETWLQRHENEASLKRVKDEFKIVNMFSELKAVDVATHQATKGLYERTIDYGGHPNEQTLTSLLKRTDEGNNVRFDLAYLSADTPAFRLALKTTAQVGVCSLLIFRNVYRERFAILGIDERLEKLKKGL
jgi:hypothetical protein